MFKDKILTITGGTGSFGKAILKKFLDSNLKEIRVFSRDEKKQEDLRISLNSSKVSFYIGDIRDQESINNVLEGCDYIFHAAALKQVPSCEFYPLEAIKTNILGTQNVINSAKNNSIKNVVLLSTDKAVYPINAMGQSKALMEKLMVAESRKSGLNNRTIFNATRYGNVMGSRGSVIPLFISQIKNGKDITITDPGMTRFLMSLDDSIDLVLHAFESNQNGDIFVKKSPSSSIDDIAQALMRIFSKKVPIKIIGTRHGEKQYESLISTEEISRAIENDDYFSIPADTRDLNYLDYNKYVVEGDSKISSLTDYNSDNTERLQGDDLVKLLMEQNFIKDALNA
jgi:UDP-N-acetylglucosamine 4,6-dehydratase/5-epimerase